MPLLVRTFIFILLLSFGYSLIDDCLRLCFDNIITQIDDIDNNETDNEEEKKATEDLEKDKILPKKSILTINLSYFVLQNLTSIDFVPTLLTAQYAINTPPPEIFLNV